MRILYAIWTATWATTVFFLIIFSMGWMGDWVAQKMGLALMSIFAFFLLMFLGGGIWLFIFSTAYDVGK